MKARNLGWRVAAALIVTALAVGACAAAPPPVSPSTAPTPAPLGPFPSDQVDGLRTDVDVAFTGVTECGGTPCRVPGDVIAPADGSQHPTIVLLNGGGKLFNERRYQAPLAVELARRGAVVFLMPYRGIMTANYDSDSISDARCAVRYARAHTAEYGGDPERLLLVGHSQGGVMGLQIAIEPDEPSEECLADGSAKPDGVVALGSPRPPLGHAGATAPPMWLIAGSEDRVGKADVEALREAGFDAEGIVLAGVTHDGVTDPAAAPQIVDLIMDALGSI
ncbi:MAG TPA: alpha/beta hydrolase [Candidatus Limnocylindria bacterium]|nr:alpha/beta hydrolase [Candidatus Limnocylindria bacterium]